MSVRRTLAIVLVLGLLPLLAAPQATATCSPVPDCVTDPIVEGCTPLADCPGYLGDKAGDVLRWVGQLYCQHVGC